MSFFLLLFYFFYQVVPSGIYLYFAISTSLTYCFIVLYFLLYMMLLLGIHKCLTPARFLFPTVNFYDMPITIVGLLLIIRLEIFRDDQDFCLNDNDDVFLEFTEYFLYTCALINSLSFLLICRYDIYKFIMYLCGFDYHQENNNSNDNINKEGLDFFELNLMKKCIFYKNDANFINNACSICITDFIDNENITKLTECGHLFHTECINDWVKLHLLCPNC